jgi:hypothetical protein
MKNCIYVALVLGLVGLTVPAQAQEVWVPAAPVPVVSYYAPAYPVTTYYAPAPATSYYVPAAVPGYYAAPYVVARPVVVPRRAFRRGYYPAYYAW